MAFINQAAPDIKRKIQKLECLGEKSIRDLVIVAEKVYNRRESVEQKEIKKKKEKRQNHYLAKVLLAATASPDECQRKLRQPVAGEEKRPKGKGRPWLEGHWARECPQKVTKGDAKVFHQRDMDSN